MRQVVVNLIPEAWGTILAAAPGGKTYHSSASAPGNADRNQRGPRRRPPRGRQERRQARRSSSQPGGMSKRRGGASVPPLRHAGPPARQACVHRTATVRRYAPADMTAGRPGWPMPGRRCRATRRGALSPSGVDPDDPCQVAVDWESPPAATIAEPGATARSGGDRAGAGSRSGISQSAATDPLFSVTVHNFLRSPPGQCRSSARHASRVRERRPPQPRPPDRYPQVKSVDNSLVAVDKLASRSPHNGASDPIHRPINNG